MPAHRTLHGALRARHTAVRTPTRERYRMFIRIRTINLRYSIICSCSSASRPTIRHPGREVSATSAGPAGKVPVPDPPGSPPGRAAESASHGMGMCWAGDLAMEEVLAAADRLRRTRAGYDLPAWGEPERPAKGTSARLGRSRPAADQPTRGPDRQQHPSTSQPAGSQPAPDPPAHDLAALDAPDRRTWPRSTRLVRTRRRKTRPCTTRLTLDPPDEDPPGEDRQDPLAEDELRAAEADAGPPMSGPEIAGHVRIEPGPDLASWLGQAQPGQQDEAGLVNSITGWRKLTSWAQAQELAAVAELGRRRGVMDDPGLDRDPSRGAFRGVRVQ